MHGLPVKVLLSHEPQAYLEGADFNLYGHFHDHWSRDSSRFVAEWPWVAHSGRYFNVSVEWINYAPATLNQIIGLRAQGLLLR